MAGRGMGQAKVRQDLGPQRRERQVAAVARPRLGHVHAGHDRRRSLAEDHDAVGQVERLVDVVGHQHHGGAQATAGVGEQVLHSQPRQRVERGERLVEEQHLGVADQRPRQRDALRHAPRELVRVGPLEPHQPDQFQQCLGGRAIGQPAGAEQHVGRDRAPGQQARLLENHGAARVGLRHDPVAEPDDPRGWPVETGDQAQQRRLAAPARAEDHQGLPRSDVETEIAQHRERAAARGKDLLDLCQADALRHPLLPSSGVSREGEGFPIAIAEASRRRHPRRRQRRDRQPHFPGPIWCTACRTISVHDQCSGIVKEAGPAPPVASYPPTG